MKHILTLILTATILMGSVSVVRAAEMRCIIHSKEACDSAGCKKVAPTIWSVIDLEKKRYSRCDSKGCDHYKMSVKKSGVYLNLEIPGKATFAKMSKDGSDFLEVATLGTTALVSHGSCK